MNDLLNLYFGKPKELAEKLCDAMVLCRSLGAKRVALLRILFRSGDAAVPRTVNVDPSDITRIKEFEKDFNKNASICNKEVQKIISMTRGGLSSVHQSGLIETWEDLLCDGVHLFEWAVPTYMRNLRNCILKNVNDARKDPNPQFFL